MTVVVTRLPIEHIQPRGLQTTSKSKRSLSLFPRSILRMVAPPREEMPRLRS